MSNKTHRGVKIEEKLVTTTALHYLTPMGTRSLSDSHVRCKTSKKAVPWGDEDARNLKTKFQPKRGGVVVYEVFRSSLVE